eukprot:TRINITY_DN5873_c0_g1_i1.p1 TRINITY_DN5873_c0_g1~~TRINITY_DN5873_c0_g1_i1.p1  ORF type:complete len:585 (-),score=101.76 TRINITY_DN5873_c0_g1_i1:397-2151(-)
MAEEAMNMDFDFAIKVAQIFSAVTFTLVATWLSFANSTSMGYVQRASLEKRLTVCCFMNTYVAMFSAFFNYFQLTKVDDLVMPDGGNATIDLARPIEWICTCPLMQLTLVIIGGTKIPEERRVIMPFLSFLVLALGLLSTYLSGWVRFVPYVIGCLFVSLMFFLNGKQIAEHSDGLESFWSGDSEYRKASLLVILLWFPFPIWYILSPEGMNIVNDQLLIQVGWAFLNIVAKFAFIFYIQRMKDNYCTKLKAKREMYKPKNICKNLDGELTAVLIETLNFLGMAHNSERVLSLFAKADITSTKQVEELGYQECKEKLLPWDIIQAVQKRLRVWRLETQDTAEVDLEEGEGHYFRPAFDPDADEDEDYIPGSLQALEYTNACDGRPWSAGSSKGRKVNEQQVAHLSHQSEAINEKLQILISRLDDLQGVQLQRDSERGVALMNRIEVLIDTATNRTERNIEALGTIVRTDMQGLGKKTLAIAEEVKNGSKAQETSLSDIRRQHMMLMELVSTDRDNMNTKISDLNTALNVKIPDADMFTQAVRGEVQRAVVGSANHGFQREVSAHTHGGGDYSTGNEYATSGDYY